MNPDHPEPDAPTLLAPTGAETPVAAPTAWRRLPRAAQRALLAGGAGAGALGLVFAALAGGPPRHGGAPPAQATRPAFVVKPAAIHPASAPSSEARQALVESVIRSQKKRIMGRKRSLPDVERIVTQIGPLVARALEQPSLQSDLRALAEQNGMSLAEYKRYFRRKQEADLLLESGGDPNARSVSNAIGVAQFLAGTARASGGLKVDLPEARRLTGRITHLQVEIAALEALPENWTKPLPAMRAPAGAHASAPTLIARAPAPPVSAPSTGAIGPSPRASLTSRGARPDRQPAAAASAPSAQEPASLAHPEPGAHPTLPATPGVAASTSEHPSLNSLSPRAEPPSDLAAPVSADPAGKSAPAAEGAAKDPGPKPAVGNPQPKPEPQKSVCPTPNAASSSAAAITRDALIAKRAQELRLLEGKRRQADERYDPAKAIASQTRYLVRMARRYSSLDWVFQAYHGGEGGVRNTVSYYLGNRWLQFASAESAIHGTLTSRGGFERVRAPLSFEDLYFKITPLAQPVAFSYLYGRSDNHRYYWWKILAAERAIDLYRRDPETFREQWRALRPGQRQEVAWYPDSKELNFADVAALKQGYADGQLVRLPASARSRGLVLGDVAPLDAANAFQYRGLRPEAMGALFRVAEVYRENGGSKTPLRILSLVQTAEYRARLNALHPPSWMRRSTKPEDVPIDLEPTGLCFDIERPASDWNRKVLEYALSWLADRNQITWIEEREQGPRRYHVCPSPDFRHEMVRVARAR